MADVQPIRTEADFDAAVARISRLMGAAPGTPESEELEVLGNLVQNYERQHRNMEYPDPVAAIEFRMDQAGLTPRDLVPFLGNSDKVSEVLSGKRQITMAMARALHRHLGIPADVLLQEPELALDTLDPTRFPLRTMVRRGWIPNCPHLMDHAEELLADLMDRAGCLQAGPVPLYRRNDHNRINAKTDDCALRAWCWQVLATANAHLPAATYRSGTVTPGWLRRVAQLSPWADGPLRAKEFLAEHGIALEVVPHLPRTHLDGAALRLRDDRPVVGLTIRYDRIDNFWFCLLHELAHVGLHWNSLEEMALIDDHSLRRMGGSQDPRESEADAWAEEALVPMQEWNGSAVRAQPSGMAVIDLANRIGVHPAIVAGRVRYERNNYRLLSQFVGSGQVRRLFAVAADLPPQE